MDIPDDKTKAERAEDVAYTINHALACTATDFIDPYFGNLTQQWLGRRYSVGCGHDHGADGSHAHHHAAGLKHWWIGEVAGDFGAVPVTVAAQRLFPSAMGRLRQWMEPVLGGFFRRGAERSAQAWAKQRGFGLDSPEYSQRVDALYRYEIEHLPQALLWTASSVAINLGTQRLTGNSGPLWQMAAGKAVGASISAGLVVGGRGFAPGAARGWDHFTSRNFFLPATRAVGKLFGVDEKAVDRMAEKEQRIRDTEWAGRVKSAEAAGKPPLSK